MPRDFWLTNKTGFGVNTPRLLADKQTGVGAGCFGLDQGRTNRVNAPRLLADKQNGLGRGGMTRGGAGRYDSGMGGMNRVGSGWDDSGMGVMNPLDFWLTNKTEFGTNTPRLLADGVGASRTSASKRLGRERRLQLSS